MSPELSSSTIGAPGPPETYAATARSRSRARAACTAAACWRCVESSPSRRRLSADTMAIAAVSAACALARPACARSRPSCAAPTSACTSETNWALMALSCRLLTVAPAGGTVTGTVVDELVDVVEGAAVDDVEGAAVDAVVVELGDVVDGAEDVVVVSPGPAPHAGRAIHGIARSTVRRTA